MGDIAAEANENGRNEPSRSEARPAAHGRPPGRRGGGLRIYKPGQGYYTRLWTAVGGSVLIIWGAAALFEQLSSILDPDTAYYYPVSYGVATAFVLGMGGLLYWIVGLSRRPNDFFIATEGEMKKVSWSTRREVARSTKVVITTVLLMAVILFMADLVFMWFFSLIGVLKGFPGFRAFFGLSS